METNESTDKQRKYFSIIKDISITIFFIVMSICVFDITKTINNTLNNLENTVKVNSTQLTNEVQSLRQDTFSYLNNTTNKLDKRINSIENNLFKRVDSIEKNTLTSVKNIENEIVLLSRDYRTIPQGTQQLFSRFENQTNCNINDYCWQNLTSDLLIDTRNTVRETSKTFQTEIPKITKDVGQMTNTFNIKFPVIVDNTTKITDNAQKFTENMDKLTKPRWYDRMIGWGVNSSIIYFNLRRFR